MNKPKISELDEDTRVRLLAEVEGWEYDPTTDHAWDRPFLCRALGTRIAIDLCDYDWNRLIHIIQGFDADRRQSLLYHLYVLHSAPKGYDLLDAETIWPMTFGLTLEQLQNAILVVTDKAEV
jgi:hypothetical protein